MQDELISKQAVDRLAWEYLRKPTDENVAFYEHFLELPSITPQELKADVLNKIRAEIERLQKMCDKNDLNLLAQYSTLGMVLEIIDKYKTESEVDNASNSNDQ